MKDGDMQRIKHIKVYCEEIAASLQRFGASYEAFNRDKDFFNSVSMSIMQIGELSLGLSDEFKNSTKDRVRWVAIRGIRNLFAHAYGTMDKPEIWKTVITDIPHLLIFCNEVIEQNR